MSETETPRVFQEAMEAVFERPEQHGDPEDSFALIADLWGDYLGIEMLAEEVADLFILMKVARNRHGVYTEDNAADVCGYAYHSDRLRRERDKSQ